MSDEYQPNEVVESPIESEAMPAEAAKPAEPATPAPEPGSSEPQTAPELQAHQSAPESAGSEPQAASELPEPSGPAVGTPTVAAAPSEPATEKMAGDPDGDGAVIITESVAPSAPTDLGGPETYAGPATDAGGNGVSEPSAEAADAAAPTSRVVSIADLTTPAPKPRRSTGISIGSLLAGKGWIAGVVVAVLVIAFLLLPPVSLAQRLGSGGGYTTLDASTLSVSHPDGLKVQRAADAEGRVRVKLGSVPRADFVAENVADDMVIAVEGVPGYLEPKSPLYTIDVKAKDAVAATLVITIPNEAEPWETLDLYSWDGSAWRWLPTQLDRDGETLTTQVAALPSSVMVMQNLGSAQHIVAEVDSWSAADMDPAIAEANVSGILIGTMGGTTGYTDQLPAAADGGATELVPTVRNWMPDREANWGLVSDMLVLESDRTAHIANLLGLAQGGGYAGLVIDYRGVPASDRDLYTRFVTDLGTAFHDAGLWLAVVVDTPFETAGGSFDTGGYDWAGLGAAADQIRVTMPLSAEAYAPGGEAEQLIAWGVTQVERHRLMPIYSTLSTDGTALLGLEDVLASMGQVQVMQTITESVIPGTQLNLTLGQLGTVETDPDTQATRVASGDQAYWLGTPQWLQARMDLAQRYRLGGVVVRNLFDAGNIAGLMPAISDFLAQDGVVAPGALPEVVWTVTDPQGKTTQATAQFDQPAFAWRAPTVTGTYTIAAMLGGVDKGALSVAVAAPAPVVTDTLAEGGATITTTAETAGEEGGADAGLKAGFVSDVTVPDNTHFEQGEAFTKTWRLQNSGTADWPKDTVLAFASGSQLGGLDEVEVGAVEAGENIDVSVGLAAPEEDGSFKSTWELRTGDKAIEGGSVYLLIQVGEQAAAPTTPANPPAVTVPVATGSFELGGHIRDLGMPYANQMHYAGMNWVKTQIFYGQGAGATVAAAHAAGFKIQLSAIGGAGMVNEEGFEDKFAAWVAQLAASGADAIEVWNEPNIDREWQVGKISPAAYTALLCKAYNAIKGANGGTAVISAAPAPTGWFGGCGPNGCDDQPWMEGLYAAGAANCMDYIGAHHNSGATSPSATIGHPANPTDTHHSWFFLPQTQLYYNIFRGTRQLFYTEMGYASQEGVPAFSDQFAWARGTNNAQQAAWLAEAVQLSINTGMVRCIIVWNIDFVRYGYDPQDGYAIIRPGGGCPACDSLHGVLGSR